MKYLHTAIRVRDLDQALAYYCGTLGFREVVRFAGHRRPCTIVFVAQPGDEGAQLELVWYHDPAERERLAGVSHLGYEVDDIYATCQQLLDRGATLQLPPSDGFMAFLRSPDGVQFELLQKGGPQAPREPWTSMPDTGDW
jgi:lactoylglutathione lyase